MGHFLEVAYKVIDYAQQPLSVREIVEIAQERGWLKSKGKTPANTMKSKLSTDILNNRESSVFMRVDNGMFALREWKPRWEEYIADRYQKALLEEDILVFPASSLSKYISGPGLHTTLIENGRDLLSLY